GVYFIMGVIGWLQWQREDAENTTASDTQTVRRITWDTVPALLLGVSSGAIVLGYLLARYTNAALPYIDSSLAAMSIAATGLQIRKFIENWLMWIVIDVAYVVVYSVRGLEITAALYFIFTVLAALGWREWRTYSAVES
ncbi:MAG: nicotinamide mononucleotide transporter, partial [Candidatus Kapabacteria bacterium]|nr:nicotinamide mononucleotide transporter [Candidatus Kapabacteria bacterium]